MKKQNKNIIKEELGISQIVNNETNELIDYLNHILSNKNNYMTFGWDDNHEVYGVSFMTKIKLFDNFDVDLLFRIALFSSYEECEKFFNEAEEPERYYFNGEDNLILISCCTYRDNFNYDTDTLKLGIKNTRLRGTLSHELKHAYQFFMKNKTPLLNDKNKRLYRNALNLTKEQKGYPSIIGYVFYYLYNIEITANAQNLWTTINQDTNGDYNKALQIFNESELFRTTKAIPLLIKLINDGTITQEQINIVQSYLNMPINKVISMLKQGNKRLRKVCGKLRTMIENNYNKSTNENVIKLSHHDLKQIIHESIRKIINEI